MLYDNPWTYKGEVVESDILEDYVGFVYLITNLTNQKKYIGKKLLKKTRTKLVKGRRKKTQVESDWKEYYGSNKELIIDVETLGASRFKREIVRLCKSKGECNYYEAEMQFAAQVLKTEDYYNTWIMVKVHKKHLPKE